MKLVPRLAVGARSALMLAQSPSDCWGTASWRRFRVLMRRSKRGSVFRSPIEAELTFHPEDQISSRAFLSSLGALRTLSTFAHRRLRAWIASLPFEAQDDG
jgi:hypothetical protein